MINVELKLIDKLEFSIDKSLFSLDIKLNYILTFYLKYSNLIMFYFLNLSPALTSYVYTTSKTLGRLNLFNTYSAKTF